MKGKKKRQKERVKTNKKRYLQATSAVENGFFLDAALIISAIMESRLKKVIELTEHKVPGAGFTLEQYLKRLKYLHLKPDNAILRESFDLTFIESMRDWKNQRNLILKDLPGIHVSVARMERLALEGMELVKGLNSACKRNRVLCRQAVQVS